MKPEALKYVWDVRNAIDLIGQFPEFARHIYRVSGGAREGMELGSKHVMHGRATKLD